MQSNPNSSLDKLMIGYPKILISATASKRTDLKIMLIYSDSFPIQFKNPFMKY